LRSTWAWSCSSERFPGLALAGGRACSGRFLLSPCLRVGHRHRERFVIGVRAPFLVRWPWPRHRLAGDLEVVDQLRPGPDGRALPGLRRVLDQLVQAWIALAVTVGFDPHGAAPYVGQCLRVVTPMSSHDRLARPAPQHANKFLLNWPVTRGP